MSRPVLPKTLTAEEAARLRRRYPRSRVPRPVLIAVVGVLALLGAGWLIWAAAFHFRSPVVGQVTAYRVLSDSRVTVTLTVDRRDPSIPVSCRVRAQAADFVTVGERVVVVPPAAHRLVDMRVTLTTVRRAVSASVAACSVA